MKKNIQFKSILLFTTISILISCQKEKEPVASFSLSKTIAEIGEEIVFTNNSQDATTFQWNFGDGNTSAIESPVHSYQNEGRYTVSLTATGEGGNNTATNDIEITVPKNIIPGVGAMNIALEERWQSAKTKLGGDITKYGFILVSIGGGSVIIHPVESKSKGILLYLISANHSVTMSDNDIVFLISLDDNFIGQTEKQIRMGSTLSDVMTAYGTPDNHDSIKKIYEYKIGIDFYYNTSSQVNQMYISTATTSNKSADITRQLLMNHIIK